MADDYLQTADVWTVLDLIVAEFESDPMSVQCFDLRLVARAKALSRSRPPHPALDPVAVAAPELLADAHQTDRSWTWLAEQMNSLTDNAKHWTVAQIENLAQQLRVGIERNQTRTRAAIAKAEGR